MSNSFIFFSQYFLDDGSRANIRVWVSSRPARLLVQILFISRTFGLLWFNFGGRLGGLCYCWDGTKLPVSGSI